MDYSVKTTEGPPFPTGEPHWGHILVGIIKAIINDTYLLNNEKVEKIKAGFDVNGIGVEALIDSKFKPKNLTEKLQLCKKFINDNIMKWEDVPNKIKRKLDFENHWATNHDYYSKSVWWAFKRLYYMGFIYKGKKICNYSVGIGTNISNSEAKENTLKLSLDCITFSYKLKDFNDANLIVWTTTPWTIPSNTICCVGNINYVLFEYENKKYVISEFAYNSNKKKVSLANFDKSKCNIIRTFNGSELVGLEYEPIFTYNNFRQDKIYHGDFIDEQKGSGVTHIVPAFGEEDMKICRDNNITDYEMKNLFDPLDEKGNYTNLCPELEGKYIFDKDTVNLICKMIRDNGNMCIKTTTQKEQNVCPRTDIPLISRAIESLFIKTTKLKDRMIEFTKKVEYTSNGQLRMLRWLESNRDWDFARNNKDWGNPIPMWESSDGEVYIPKNIEELEEKCNKKINSFLKDEIDSLQIKSSKGLLMTRYPALFDCWFESGCAPFASRGYPFVTTKMDFYPMDYVAESHDQIRGWFYSLLVFSIALFDTLPYKKVFMTGMILAKNGEKMSKRKENYEPFDDVIKLYSCDAIRLYLTNSPVVEAGNLLFNEDNIKDCNKDIVHPLKSCKNFLIEYTTLYEKQNGEFKFNSEISDEKFDQWLYSITNKFTTDMMEHYDSFKFKNLKIIVQSYIYNLNNWYIKFMRNTLKGLNGKEVALKGLSTLNNVLKHVAHIIKPLMPETSEFLYDEEYKNVELLYNQDIIDEHIILNRIVNNIRDIKDKNIKKNNKYPITNIKIYTSPKIKQIINEYKEYIMYEINSEDIQLYDYDNTITSKNINFDFRTFMKQYNKTSNFKTIVTNYKNNNNDIPEEKSYPKAFNTTYNININSENFNKYIPENKTLVSISKQQDSDFQKEIYKLRCLYSSIQKMRGTAKLHPWNKICIKTTNLNKEYLENILKKNKCVYHNKKLVETLYDFLNNENIDNKLLLEENIDNDNIKMYLSID